MARKPGSKNKRPALTGSARKRCKVCGRHGYLAVMKKAGKRGTIQLYKCKTHL